MLILIHVISALIAVASSIGIGVYAAVTKTSPAKSLLSGSVGATTLTAITGVGLIFTGSSIVRVCAEGVSLVALNYGVLYYAKLLRAQTTKAN